MTQTVESGITKVDGVLRLLIFGILAYSGLLKLHEPKPSADFVESLTTLNLGDSMRFIGGAEVVLGLWLASSMSPVWSALACAGLFTAFLVMHVAAWAYGLETSCGCGGDTPVLARLPRWGWAVLSGVLISLCICSACASSTPRKGTLTTTGIAGEPG